MSLENNKLKTENETAGNDSRFREIVSVLHRHQVTRGISPEKLRLILEDLGPTYIKLGQIMSLHSDILPQSYCNELMKLTSDVSPMPFREVIHVIENSYNCGWHEVFEKIDSEPIGSASIAQVHRAELLSGEQVIIKVERHGIYNTMSQDIRLLHKAARLLKPVPNLRNVVDIDMVLDELWTVAQEEMDFLREASNMEEFASRNAGISYIRVPRLYREYTSSKVLVMEYIGGYPINDADGLLAEGYDLEEIGVKFVNNFLKQVMEDGFFHADPHPGNVKVYDGKIVWLDMGMMGRLTERDREIMVKAVEGIAMKNIDQVTDAVLLLGKFRGTPDKRQLFRDIRDFLMEYGGQGFGSVNIAETMHELLDIMKNNHISVPHGMTMLARGLTHVEGVLADISPDLNMLEIAATRAGEEALRKIDWKSETKKNARRLYRSASKGIEIPSLVYDVLSEALKGESRFTLKLEPSESLDDLVHTAVRNLVIGVCVTALLISSSIICTTDMTPELMGIPFLGFAGYAIAILTILFFLIRYLVRKYRKWKN